jgi:hypothetical protein
MTYIHPFIPTLFVSLVLAGCATPTSLSPPTASVPTNPQQAFMSNLQGLCGKAYEGRMVTTDPRDADIGNQRLIMDVRSCNADSIRIPFHVGADRSRTWVISNADAGLRLKHDHRHEDGSPDISTQYGGDTASRGSANRQEFPVDTYSKELFLRTGSVASVTNVWTVEIIPGQTYTYELKRENRHFKVEFDLTQPVTSPPPPWGG